MAAGLVVTDLDGTLLRSDRTFNEADLEALERAGREGRRRVIATGRSLFSFRRSVARELPVDYIIFSTGGGVLDVRSGEIIRVRNLDGERTRAAARLLMTLGLDFAVHEPLPDNHRFNYHPVEATHPDHRQRIELYRGHCEPMTGPPEGLGESAQLIAIVEPSVGEGLLPRLRGALGERFNVVRTTSPLDHATMWIEVFPAEVSKGQGLAWLADREGVGPADVLVVGNDWNDLDMLEWAGSPFVVAGAPPELRARFPVVASHDEGGVAEAIARWSASR
jgi:hydroxymethylpyrimidine pyrophosphatase-like HAD family hydrolase